MRAILIHLAGHSAYHHHQAIDVELDEASPIEYDGGIWHSHHALQADL